MEAGIKKVLNLAFLTTGLAYGTRQLGTLGQLALPSGSALASYSATMAEIANRALPITSVALGGAALTTHFADMRCKKRCLSLPIVGVWALSIGLAPLLPAHIGPWVERMGRGFFAISSPINQYFYHKEDEFKRPTGWLGSIAELAGAGLFSPLPGGQWIEPIAGLGAIASLVAFKNGESA